jgi:hypothetical protein
LIGPFFIFVSIPTPDKLRDEDTLSDTDHIEDSLSSSTINLAQKQSQR